jgi:regulatory protein
LRRLVRRRVEAAPLDRKRLEDMALRYVGRFATTRAKLRSYLMRKLRERGWDGAGEPDLDALAGRLAELGYIDDAAYAMSKAQALSARGFGKRRLDEKLRHAGVAEEDGAAAREHAGAQAVDAALRFAERRKIGPFASAIPDPKQREKALAAMIRAGHPFGLARAIIRLGPGEQIDQGELREQSGLDP